MCEASSGFERVILRVLNTHTKKVINAAIIIDNDIKIIAYWSVGNGLNVTRVEVIVRLPFAYDNRILIDKNKNIMMKQLHIITFYF